MSIPAKQNRTADHEQRLRARLAAEQPSRCAECAAAAAPCRHYICAICLDAVEPAQDLDDLPCTHIFHADCLARAAVGTHVRCPACRAEFVRAPATYTYAFAPLGRPSAGDGPRHDDPGRFRQFSDRAGERLPLWSELAAAWESTVAVQAEQDDAAINAGIARAQQEIRGQIRRDDAPVQERPRAPAVLREQSERGGMSDFLRHGERMEQRAMEHFNIPASESAAPLPDAPFRAEYIRGHSGQGGALVLPQQFNLASGGIATPNDIFTGEAILPVEEITIGSPGFLRRERSIRITGISATQNAPAAGQVEMLSVGSPRLTQRRRITVAPPPAVPVPVAFDPAAPAAGRAERMEREERVTLGAAIHEMTRAHMERLERSGAIVGFYIMQAGLRRLGTMIARLRAAADTQLTELSQRLRDISNFQEYARTIVLDLQFRSSTDDHAQVLAHYNETTQEMVRAMQIVGVIPPHGIFGQTNAAMIADAARRGYEILGPALVETMVQQMNDTRFIQSAAPAAGQAERAGQSERAGRAERDVLAFVLSPEDRTRLLHAGCLPLYNMALFTVARSREMHTDLLQEASRWTTSDESTRSNIITFLRDLNGLFAEAENIMRWVQNGLRANGSPQTLWRCHERVPALVAKMQAAGLFQFNAEDTTYPRDQCRRIFLRGFLHFSIQHLADMPPVVGHVAPSTAGDNVRASDYSLEEVE